MVTVIGAGLVALVITMLIVATLQKWALRVGWVYRPQPDRWQPKSNPHPRTIALGGGLGILAAVMLALLISLWQGNLNPLWAWTMPLALAIALLGLLDDLRGCSAHWKLLAQVVIALTTTLKITRLAALPDSISVPLTTLSLVALINAVNMMDNMDGTASGLVTLSSLGFAALGILTDNPPVTTVSLILAASSFGFWLFNKPPSSIFMGDVGSLFLGYLLGVVAVTASQGRYPHAFAAIFVPALMVGCFVADITFVTLWRLTHRLPLMKGDRNHLSHRLAVRFEGSERQANLVLYGLQLAFCGAALLAAIAPPLGTLTIVGVALLVLATLFLYLWQVVPN